MLWALISQYSQVDQSTVPKGTNGNNGGLWAEFHKFFQFWLFILVKIKKSKIDSQLRILRILTGNFWASFSHEDYSLLFIRNVLLIFFSLDFGWDVVVRDFQNNFGSMKKDCTALSHRNVWARRCTVKLFLTQFVRWSGWENINKISAHFQKVFRGSKNP